LRRD